MARPKLGLLSVLALGTLAVAGAVAQPFPVLDDSLSIAECARLARRQAPEVQVASFELSAARFDSVAARRLRRPVVSILGSAWIAPRGFYDPVITDLGAYDLKLGFTLPLRDAGEAARERERTTNDARRAALEKDRVGREAALRAAGLAIRILDLGEQAAARRWARNWLAELDSLVASRVRGGASSPADRVRVELERDGVESELASLETEIAIAGRELGRALGWVAGATPRVRAPDPRDDRAPAPVDSIDLLARVTRLPEVRLAAIAEAQARLAQDEAEHRTALRAELAGDAGLWGADLTRLVPPDLKAEDPDAGLGDRLRRDLGASATVSFQRPLLDATRAPAVAARRAGVEAAARQRSAETDVQQGAALDLLDRWRSGSRRRAVAQASAELAETHVLRMKTLYAGGSVALLDLLDSRQVLEDARVRLADARAEERAARAEAEIEP